MKRDMELVRDILLAIEASNTSPLDRVPLQSPGHSEEEISYHVELLARAGLIDANDASSFDGHCWYAKSLTWNGHEFLDAVRDPEVWRRTKEGASKAGNASIEFIWELAKAYGKHVIKERLGIDLAGVSGKSLREVRECSRDKIAGRKPVTSWWTK